MKPWFLRLTWVGLLAAAAAFGWGFVFPSPEHLIRKDLVELAQAVSMSPNDAALTKLAKTQKVVGFFTTDAQISIEVPGRSPQTLNGREDLQQAVLAARSMLNSLRVQFVDVGVTLAPDKQSAVADLTATANLPGEKIPEVQEMEIRFKKIDRDWLISQVETVKTLR